MKKLASKGLLMSALICGNVLWGGTTVLANEVQEYELDEMVAQEYKKLPLNKKRVVYRQIQILNEYEN